MFLRTLFSSPLSPGALFGRSCFRWPYSSLCVISGTASWDSRDDLTTSASSEIRLSWSSNRFPCLLKARCASANFSANMLALVASSTIWCPSSCVKGGIHEFLPRRVLQMSHTLFGFPSSLAVIETQFFSLSLSDETLRRAC